MKRASISHQGKVDEIKRAQEAERASHSLEIEKLRHEMKILQSEKEHMQSENEHMQSDVRSLNDRIRTLSHNVVAISNNKTPVSEPPQHQFSPSQLLPTERGDQIYSTPLSKKQKTALGSSFKDGFANYYSSARKRKQVQNLPDRALELRKLMYEPLQEENQEIIIEDPTSPEVEAIPHQNNTPQNQHDQEPQQMQNENEHQQYQQENLQQPTAFPAETDALLEDQKAEIKFLKSTIIENSARESSKEEIISFIEMLNNHSAYGNFSLSWDILSKWTLKTDGSLPSLPISRILQSSLFDETDIEIFSLTQVVDNFLERCKLVIYKCVDENRYGPIPIIFQLISSSVEFFPQAILLEHSLTAFICSFLEGHISYIKTLPNSTTINDWKYDPFKLPSSYSYYTETSVRIDSQIFANDAFKEISIIYSLDVLENISSNAGTLSREAYQAVWGNVPFNMIISLLSHKSTSNILLKVVLTLLSSISETTIGPIRRELLQTRTAPSTGTVPQNGSMEGNAEEQQKSKTQPQNGSTSFFSRARSTTPGFSRAPTPLTSVMNGEKSAAALNSTSQQRNEKDLINSLASLLTNDISPRHILLFSGLENITSTTSCIKMAENAKLSSPPSHKFNYIFYHDVSLLGEAASEESRGQTADMSFTTPLTFTTLYKSKEQLFYELTELNSATTLFLRRAIIKFFLLSALMKSPTLITQSQQAMVATIQCMARNLDLVHQSVEPDPSVTALISDCVTLLHTLWDLLMPPPAPPTSSSELSSHPLTTLLGSLPHGVNYELVIAMSRIGFSGGGSEGADNDHPMTDESGEGALQDLSPPLFSAQIAELARKVLEYNITTEEAEFICTQLDSPF